MSGRESAACARLRRAVQEDRRLTWRRVIHRFEEGWPDVLLLSRATGGVALVEFKQCDAPRGKLDLRPAQGPWLRQWALDGGRGAVLVSVGAGWWGWPAPKSVEQLQTLVGANPWPDAALAGENAEVTIAWLAQLADVGVGWPPCRRSAPLHRNHSLQGSGS